MSYSAFHLGGDERRTIKETFTQLRGWDPSLGAYGVTGSDGTVISFTNNHSLLPGDVVRHDGGPANQGQSNETVGWIKALANNPENAEALGVVESVEGSTFVVVLQGRFRLDLMSDTLSYPKVYYLDREIPGKLVCHQPQGAGEVIKPMLLTTDVKNGYIVNYIGTTIGGDCTVDVTEISPVGQVLPFAGPTGQIPDGHLLCNGSKYITGGKWKDLFNVIGHNYGMSGGSDTDWFHIPDLQGRFPLGSNVADSGTGLTTRTLGTTGGSEIATLAAGDDFDGSTITGPDREITGDNMPPFTAINFIIRYQKDANAVVHCPSAGGPFTNKIINGNFDYWQRGTNYNATGGITGNQSFYTADRWVHQVHYDDITSKEWAGGINLGRFAEGQVAVPYYPKYYAKIQSYLTGQEAAQATFAGNFNDPQGIDGQTIGIVDSSRYNRAVNVVGGSIRTNEGIGFPSSWTDGAGTQGKKATSTSWRNQFASTGGYCVGEHHASTLKEDWTAVAGPFDWSKKDEDYPDNGIEFTIEGWFKITGACNGLTGAATGGACTGHGGHAPITLLRFGTPPTTGCRYEYVCGSPTGDSYPCTGNAFGLTGCSGGMTTGIDGRWQSSIQFIATDDTGFGYPQGNHGSITGPLWPVVQWNTESATGWVEWQDPPVFITGHTNINDGEWHHLCFARNNYCNEFKLYVDGILEGEKGASGNEIMGPVWAATGGTGGVDRKCQLCPIHNSWNTSGDCYIHSDMYIFGALDLENVCTTGDYCADQIKITEGIDKTTERPPACPTGCCFTTGHYGFTGDSEPGYPYRNYTDGDTDEFGAGAQNLGFCAFSQRIEGVKTFAESQDEYVTLSFWAKGQPGPQQNGDIHINIKQCFGSDIPLLTGYGEEVYGYTARTAGSGIKLSSETNWTIAAKSSGGKALADMGTQDNLEFDATLLTSANIKKIGVTSNVQECDHCTETCFDCGATIPEKCNGCQCCSHCQSFAGDCANCPPGTDCGVDSCPLGYCCYSKGETTITTCEECGGSWTNCNDPKGKCFGRTTAPDGTCDWYEVPNNLYSAMNNDSTAFRIGQPGDPEGNAGGGGFGSENEGPTHGQVGACCDLCTVNHNGCVDEIDKETCTALGGTYQGDGSVCGHCTSLSACCVSYGVCCDGKTVENAYTTGAVNYIGLGCLSGTDTVCDGIYLHISYDGPADEHDYPNGLLGLCITGATGACCESNQTCSDSEFVGDCEGNSGAYWGWGTNCSDSNIDCTTGGACCHWDGTCIPMSNTTQCERVSGTWHGTGTVCGSVTCIGHGACCNEADGECYEVVSGDCGGDYLAGEHCYDVICDRSGGGGNTGACCTDGISSVTTEIECEDGGGKWYGTGTASDNTSCCRVLPGVRISLYPVWKKYEITFKIPHLSNMSVGDRGNDYVEINFFSYADIQSGIENKLVGYGSDTIPELLPCNYPHEYNIAQVQMERGQKSSRWEAREDGIEKRLCERYYEVRRDFGYTSFKHLTGNENHGDTSAPPTGGTFHHREYITYDAEKLYERPEVFVFGLEEPTYRLTGFSVINRNADGFILRSNYNTGSNAGIATLTGNYAVISEIYTPTEETQLGYDFYINDEGA